MTSTIEYRREWESKNKDKRRVYNRVGKDKLISWFKEYKSSCSCLVCGENESCTIDFHHTDPSEKEYTIASLVHTLSGRKLRNELKKCIPLCSNCHRKVHAGIIQLSL